MTETELAWAAGFFDGEGHVSYHPKTYSLRVQLGQNHRDTLERFETALGLPGTIHFAPKSTGREYWTFHIYGRDNVVAAYRLLAPYLSRPKREQFHAAFEGFNERPFKYKGWEANRNRIKVEA